MSHFAKILCRHQSRLLNLQNLQVLTKRGVLWQFWLDSIMNKVDEERIQMVGPDRACAEWLLKCGGKVKWKDIDRWYKDYNLLPGVNFERFKIQEIDATGSCVMNSGLNYLKGLKELNRIIFHECTYVNDTSMQKLLPVKNSLEHLHVSKCANITEKGLYSLLDLKNLKTLKLFELSGVENRESCYKLLCAELPHCDVDYEDVHHSNQPEKQQNGG